MIKPIELSLKCCRDIDVSAMKIKSVCPKCGQIGIQNINYKPSKANAQRAYLRFYHKRNQCYIGRVRTTDEAMSEFNKPETKEEYKKTLTNLVKDVRKLIIHYSPNTAVRMNVISKKLNNILTKYDL